MKYLLKYKMPLLMLLLKTEKAILEFNPKSIFIGGGVSSNKKLQKN